MKHLEEKLAHLERVIDDLSDVVARQDSEIVRLTAQVKALIAREAEREAQMGGSVVIGQERPPHY